MKDKIVKAVAISVVSIISASLVAYLQDPVNRASIKIKAKKAQKEANKQIKILRKKINSFSKA